MFSKVLVADVGAAAVRVIRACRELGVATVAVHSEGDALAPHVLVADEAVLLDSPESSPPYLRIEGILEAARRTGAQAIHPGYSSLAENPSLALACRESSLVFIGPPPAVITALKDASLIRQLAEAARVPVIPEVESRDITATAWHGTQMRLHHIAVPILADVHGSIMHLGEWEHMAGRQHQRLVDESPSPFLDDAMRRTLGEAAVRLARAAGYVNAVTVEFLVDRWRNFYFLGLNTLPPADHPATELVTGVDLVQAQVRIAAGDAIPPVDDVKLRGCALLCTICSEDPGKHSAQSTDRVLYLHEPSLPGVRIDSRLYRGQCLSTSGDPILARVMAWAPTRPVAIRRMTEALKEHVILGPQTNLAHLMAVMECPALLAGELPTYSVAEYRDERPPPRVSPKLWAVAAMLTAKNPLSCSADSHLTSGPTMLEKALTDPWDSLQGWRLS